MVDTSAGDSGTSQPDAESTRPKVSLKYHGWQQYPETLLGYSSCLYDGTKLRQRVLEEQQLLFEPAATKTCKVSTFEMTGMRQRRSREDTNVLILSAKSSTALCTEFVQQKELERHVAAENIPDLRVM